MRKLIGWIAGLVGVAALARVLARRNARPAPPPRDASPPGGDPAEELRRKLSETREAPATPPESGRDAAEPSESIDERRARVHAKAQEAIETMQEPLE